MTTGLGTLYEDKESGRTLSVLVSFGVGVEITVSCEDVLSLFTFAPPAVVFPVSSSPLRDALCVQRLSVPLD